MSREWKPGDVALIRVGTGEWEHGVRNEYSRWVCRHGENHADTVATVPLVVIDPEDREQVERLTKVMDEEFERRGWANQSTPDPDVVDAIQAALREFANPTPPKPEEPRGLGAVVVDAEGRKWTRAGDSSMHGNWLSLGSSDYVEFGDITAVRVLSEGVSA